MTDMDCAEARNLAAEFALDILPPEERSRVAAHLLRCPECQAEVQAMERVGERLLDLVPGTEPPLGFDRRVLERVRPARSGARRVLALPRRRPGTVAGALVAVAAAVALLVAGLTGTTHHPRVVLDGVFRENGRQVGSVYGYAGTPPWLNIEVAGSSLTGMVTCEAVAPGGQVTKLGSFDVVGGSGKWGAPDPAGTNEVAAVRLVDSRGAVVATATMKNGAWTGS